MCVCVQRTRRRAGMQHEPGERRPGSCHASNSGCSSSTSTCRGLPRVSIGSLAGSLRDRLCACCSCACSRILRSMTSLSACSSGHDCNCWALLVPLRTNLCKSVFDSTCTTDRWPVSDFLHGSREGRDTEAVRTAPQGLGGALQCSAAGPKQVLAVAAFPHAVQAAVPLPQGKDARPVPTHCDDAVEELPEPAGSG